jgi:hypothetical protein
MHGEIERFVRKSLNLHFTKPFYKEKGERIHRTDLLISDSFPDNNKSYAIPSIKMFEGCPARPQGVPLTSIFPIIHYTVYFGWKPWMEALDGSLGWKPWMEALDGSLGWKPWMEALDKNLSTCVLQNPFTKKTARE